MMLAGALIVLLGLNVTHEDAGERRQQAVRAG